MPQLTLFQPDAFLGPGDPPDLGPFRRKFLAQGDSWFSIGAALAPSTTNILLELSLAAKACAANCARPGATLSRMVDTVREPKFRALLASRQAWQWDGILMSAGGNDLIGAIQVLPHYSGGPNDGQPIPPNLRILLTSDEWKAGPSADRYISDAGWTTFSNYLQQVFAELIALRDGARSLSRNAPVFVHCYDYLLARPAPAGPGIGPWLFPALSTYGIPSADWAGVGRALIDRLRTLLQGLGLPELHVVDTTPGTLTPAVAGSSGVSNDWQNEIHPTKQGYSKIAAKYGAVVDVRLP